MEYSKIDQDHSSPSKEQFKIDSAMRIGYVSLNVSDINTSIDFYKSILGFKTVGRVSNERALLGVSGAGTSSYLVELLQEPRMVQAQVRSAGRRRMLLEEELDYTILQFCFQKEDS